MVISSSGTGNPGGIPEFSLLSDQSAAANTQRTAMGIVGNLDTLFLTDFGKKTKWRYESSATKPTLHPLEHVRVDAGQTSRIDDSWKQLFEELLKKLPEDVRSAYEYNLSLPDEEKNASLVALGKLLEGSAKALVWMNNSVAALNPESLTAGPDSEMAARQSMNLSLPGRVTNGILGESQAVFSSLHQSLLKIGSNHPHFDELLGILNHLGGAYTALSDINKETAREKYEQGD